MAATEDPRVRRFPSKIDAWIAILLVGGFAVPLALALSTGGRNVVMLAILCPALAFVLWLLAGTTYAVTPDALIVRAGPFRWSIPASSLRSLQATHNPLSSPALSLDRIDVRHMGGRVLISPRDQEGFVRAVLAIAPQVSVVDLPHANATSVETTGSAARSRLSWLVVAVQLPVLALVGVVLYAGTRPPTIAMGPNGVTIHGGMSTRAIADDQVLGVALEPTLPAARKRAGFNAGPYLRGSFEVAGIGRADLFVKRGVAPYVYIRLKPGSSGAAVVIVNFSEPAQTRALFDELRERWR